MLIPSSKPRHTLEKAEHFVRITLPSKRNIFRVLFFCFWFFMWGYMIYGLSYVLFVFMRVIEMGLRSTPPIQPGVIFLFVIIFFVFFFLMLLGLGLFAIYRFGWLLVGREVVEATPQTLRVTKQIFQWKRAKEYSSEKVSNLRTNTQPLSIFLPGKRVKRFLGGAGMIAFNHRGRTTTFGLEISDTEAEQIILALQEVLSQQSAG
jgi:hypothetical protein